MFMPANRGEDPEVRRLKAELQVEEDRRRMLNQRARNVEAKQSARDSDAALKMLEEAASSPNA
jgi:hypothetical protein